MFHSVFSQMTQRRKATYIMKTREKQREPSFIWTGCIYCPFFDLLSLINLTLKNNDGKSTFHHFDTQAHLLEIHIPPT